MIHTASSTASETSYYFDLPDPDGTKFFLTVHPNMLISARFYATESIGYISV